MLIGDSTSRQYRSSLGRLIKRPVDFFATSTQLSDELFWKQLELFFSISEYRQKKVQIQIGYHGADIKCGASELLPLSYFEAGYERLVQMVKQYIPDITIATATHVVQRGDLSQIDITVNNLIIERNNIMKNIAKKYNLPVNDLYEYMLKDGVAYKHTDQVHFENSSNDFIAKKVAQSLKLL